MKKNTIKDFGKKIGGARKDVWKGRGLSLIDLGEMNDAEKKTYVKKDNVWPKPEWDRLITDGANKAVTFWKNEVRKAVPKDPSAMNGDGCDERYVSFVQELRARVMEVADLSEARSVYHWIKAERYIVMLTMYHCEVNRDFRGLITNPLLKALQSTDPYVLMHKKTYELFGVPKDDADYVLAKDRMNIFLYDGQNVVIKAETIGSKTRKRLEIHQGSGTLYYYPKKIDEYEKTWVKGSWFIADSSSRDVLAFNFSSLEEAREKSEEIARAAKDIAPKRAAASKTTKTAFRYPQLSWVEREGKDYRKGTDATPELLMQTFGFSGGEFGNWLGNKERQGNLNLTYDAFMDLADILGINPKHLTFHGTLSIAFGARGKGGASAASAHYDPLRKVINLTRLNGAGCLAHEWAHALDHFLVNPFVSPLATAFTSEFVNGPTMPDYWKRLIKALKRKEDGTYTDYFIASQKFDQMHRKNRHGYWSSNCEMFARAFDCYLSDLLKAKGLRDDYLTAYSDCFMEEINGTVYHAFPVGEERKRINALFDEMLDELKKAELL